MRIALQGRHGTPIHVDSAPLRQSVQDINGRAAMRALPHVQVTQDCLQLASQAKPIGVLVSVLEWQNTALGFLVTSAPKSVHAWLFDLGHIQLQQWLGGKSDVLEMVFQAGAMSSRARLAATDNLQAMVASGEAASPVTTDLLMDAVHFAARLLESAEQAVCDRSANHQRRGICIHLIVPGPASALGGHH